MIGLTNVLRLPLPGSEVLHLLPRTATIIAIALVAALGTPAGGAASPAGCEEVPREEIRFGYSFQLDENTYLYLPKGDASDAEKVGIWEQNNEYEGLQTEDCWAGTNKNLYVADAYAAPSVP